MLNRREVFAWLLATAVCLSSLCLRASAQEAGRPFHVVVLAEPGGIHAPFVLAAKTWLQAESEREHFTVEYLEDTKRIDRDFLSRCQILIQLNYPPYNWTPQAAQAFENYIDQGQGGWIGFHHATLLGEFDGYPMWPWFSQFMGGIRWKDYIRTFATGTVHVEQPAHPVMRGLPATFTIKDEEWYTWDRSPRPNVDVLASVDENTYRPDTNVKMGDHPVIWSNPHKKARNVYFFTGHHPELLQDRNFTMLFHNAILWAAQR